MNLSTVDSVLRQGDRTDDLFCEYTLPEFEEAEEIAFRRQCQMHN